MITVIQKMIIFPEGKGSYEIKNTDYYPQMGELIKWNNLEGIVERIETVIKDKNLTTDNHVISIYYFLK